MLAVKTHGCLCCWIMGYPHDPDGPMVEAHHLLSGGRRRGHRYVVGLCQWHHRGQPTMEGWTMAQHRQRLGSALSEGSVPFRECWGSDAWLLEQQGKVLRDKWLQDYRALLGDA